MTEKRPITIQIRKGNRTITQSSGQVKVDINLDNCEPETIEWLFEKGLILAIRNAYASEKTTADRQIEAQRKANEIANNIRHSGKSSSWTEIEAAMIRIFVMRKYKGVFPQGGMHVVWQEIAELPVANLERLREVARVTIETTI